MKCDSEILAKAIGTALVPVDTSLSTTATTIWACCASLVHCNRVWRRQLRSHCAFKEPVDLSRTCSNNAPENCVIAFRVLKAKEIAIRRALASDKVILKTAREVRSTGLADRIGVVGSRHLASDPLHQAGTGAAPSIGRSKTAESCNAWRFTVI
jgi:hypothetical protein